MKRFLSFTIVLPFTAGLLVTSGCVSAQLVNNKAKTHWEFDKEQKQSVQVDGQPAYYALLPFTIAADIATSPFQLYFYLAFHVTGDGP